MDLFDTLDRFSHPDALTCRALARYLINQADRLQRRAEMLEEAARRATKRAEARARRKRGDAPGQQRAVEMGRRNRAIVMHAARGWTNSEIADKFGLSPNYVGQIIKAGFAHQHAPAVRTPKHRTSGDDGGGVVSISAKSL